MCGGGGGGWGGCVRVCYKLCNRVHGTCTTFFLSHISYCSFSLENMEKFCLVWYFLTELLTRDFEWECKISLIFLKTLILLLHSTDQK